MNKKLGWGRFGVLSGAVLLASQGIHAEPMIGTTRGSFGLPGLIDMPAAENAPDATLGTTISVSPSATRTTLTFQIAPRLSGAFRYSRVAGVYNGDALYDRSFDVQYQFLDEGPLTPAIAVGLRDFIGTGVYSSEYVVATKALTPTLRVSGGIGWGRLGSEGGLGSPFGERPVLDIGEGGTANVDQLFRGEMAPFFGLSWQATDRLTLKAEYSSDAYEREVAAGELERKSSLNFGADYQIGRGAHVSGYYLYGSELGLQLHFDINPRMSTYPSGVEKTPLPVRPRPSRATNPDDWSTDWTTDPAVHPGIQKAVASALEKDGQVLESMALSGNRVEVRVRNLRYGAAPQAIGHTARVLTRALPPSVETFVITPVERGIPTASVTLRRTDIEALEHAPAFEILRRTAFTDAIATSEGGLRPTEGLYPKFTWSLGPYLHANLFDPDDPIRADVGLELNARYQVAPNLQFSGSLRKKVVGNLSQSDRVSDSVLPHVRSDAPLYQTEGDPGIKHLTLAWYGRPAPDYYARVTAGYLETMFGGVSGEVLWKPVDSRFALGLEVNYVRQRDFDQLFGFQDYDVATGHVSAYYDFGKGYVGQLDVGRYLAGDWGATVSLDREFANGWKVGAFATFTDVSAAEFGEGSFDKGIRLTVPISWAIGQPSTTAINTTIRPLNRDGGARLGVDGRLYETIRGTHQGDLQQSWGRFWR